MMFRCTTCDDAERYPDFAAIEKHMQDVHRVELRDTKITDVSVEKKR